MAVHNTKGPLRVVEGFLLYDDNGQVLAVRGDSSDAPKTAADIARIVNAHDAMVAALEKARDYMMHPMVRNHTVPAGASLLAVLEAITEAKGAQS